MATKEIETMPDTRNTDERTRRWRRRALPVSAAVAAVVVAGAGAAFASGSSSPAPPTETSEDVPPAPGWLESMQEAADTGRANGEDVSVLDDILADTADGWQTMSTPWGFARVDVRVLYREARNAESIADIAEFRELDSEKVVGYGAAGPLQFITIEEYEALDDQADFDALLEEALDERRALGMAE